MRFTTILLTVLMFGVGCETAEDSDDLADDAGNDASDAQSRYVLDTHTVSTMDKAGGEMQLGEMTIRIPEGALDDKVELGIKVVELPVPIPDAYVQASDAYECTPHGIAFAKPLQMDIGYESVSQRPHHVLRLDDRKDNSWEVVEFTDIKAGVASWEVTGFSFFVVVYEVERALSKPDAGTEPDFDSGAADTDSSIDSSCGNGIVESAEECDDGNLDDSDGCDGNCRFTCVSTDPDRNNCRNDCNPTSVCDDATHMCVDGNPLPDDTICDSGNGYCLNGICTASICGDGNQEPNEECDDGNTADGDGCSSLCTLSVCGDGVIEGSEQCDDGNRANLDGCDQNCRVELTMRLKRIGLSLDVAPDLCTFSDNEKMGNALSDLFPVSDVLDSLQNQMNAEIEAGFSHSLLQLLNLDDPSLQVSDPLVQIGTSTGWPVNDWQSSVVHLDSEIYINSTTVDDDDMPVSILPAEAIIEDGEAILQTTSAGTAIFSVGNAEFTVYEATIQMPIDSTRSPLTPPPDTVESLVAPETAGGDAEPEPQAVLCGAIDLSAFDAMPITEEIAALCTDTSYDPCQQDEEPTSGACDSVSDLLRDGCSDLQNVYVMPIGEPDADTDGDSVDDSYSVVFTTSFERVKVVGLEDP
jgi:cysteine-rich repeat protein